MEELLEAIRAAVASGASAEQKARGAQACRAIASALDAEAGKPIAVPSAPPPHPLAGMPLGQALDLLIAKLTAALPPEEAKDAAKRTATRNGMRIKLVPVPPRSRALGANARPSQPTRGRP